MSCFAVQEAFSERLGSDLSALLVRMGTVHEIVSERGGIVKRRLYVIHAAAVEFGYPRYREVHGSPFVFRGGRIIERRNRRKYDLHARVLKLFDKPAYRRDNLARGVGGVQTRSRGICR